NDAQKRGDAEEIGWDGLTSRPQTAYTRLSVRPALLVLAATLAAPCAPSRTVVTPPISHATPAGTPFALGHASAWLAHGKRIGGRGVVIHDRPARTVGELKLEGAPYSLKMACGENPKRVYGERKAFPSTRMGNYAGYRQAFAQAAEYKKKVDKAKGGDPPPRD